MVQRAYRLLVANVDLTQKRLLPFSRHLSLMREEKKKKKKKKKELI